MMTMARGKGKCHIAAFSKLPAQVHKIDARSQNRRSTYNKKWIRLEYLLGNCISNLHYILYFTTPV